MEYFDVLSVLSKEDRKRIKKILDDPITEMINDIREKIPKEIGERIKREFEDKKRSLSIRYSKNKG